MLGVFKNSLSCVYGLKCLSSSVNLILGALFSEFHPTGSTSEGLQKKEQLGKCEQKTKIMETAKSEGGKEIKIFY